MASSPIDIGQLSQSQQDALSQYTAVTNQEVEDAIPLLQRSQWNLQIAIAKFFDGEQPDPVAEALAAQTAAPSRTNRTENLQESLLRGSSSRSSSSRNSLEAAPRIVPQREDQLMPRPPLLLAIISAPFSLIYRILSSTFGFFTFLFPFLPRLLQSRAATRTGRTNNTSGRRSLNPRDTAARFKREFDEDYGPNELSFFEGGYAAAQDLAKKELKFLLIILLSPEHDLTRSFVQDTLLSSEIINFIRDPKNNLLVWGGNVQDSEAYQVSTSLRCSKFPFSALLAVSQSSSSLVIAERISGPMSPSTYLAKMQGAISKHAEPLAAMKAARAARDMDRTIRQDQESAYQRSLKQDRERTRLKREAETAAAAAAKKAQEDAAKAETDAQNLRKWRLWRCSRIAPEPGAEVKDTVRIGLRMPESAERVVRKFSAGASMEELYAFVECYEILKEGPTQEKAVEPTNYEHRYGFRLVSPMPRAVYDISDGGTILERVGKSGQLIVEPTQEDDED